MKAKCKCGHVFDVRFADEGKVVSCPDCGQKVRLPEAPKKPAPPEPPPLAEKELEKEPDFGPKLEWGDEDKFEKLPLKADKKEQEFDWGDFKLEGEEAEHKPPASPKPPEEPAAEPELAFQEFPLEEPESQPPSTSAPLEPTEDKPAEESPMDFALEETESRPAPQPFGSRQQQKPKADQEPSEEFFVKGSPASSAKDEDVVELDADAILGVRRPSQSPAEKTAAPRTAAPKTAAPKATAPPAVKPPPSVASGEMKICKGCGRIITEEVPVCPECGLSLVKSQPTEVKPTPGVPAWANSLLGSFAYAYPGSIAGDGLKSLLVYVQVGVVWPLVLILITRMMPCVCCVTMPLWLLISFGAVVGTMWFFMAHTAGNGMAPMMGAAKPLVVEDVIIPAAKVIASSALLVFGPVGVGVVAGASVVGANVIHMMNQMRQNQDFSSLTGAAGIASGLAIIMAAVLFGMFCLPMIMMILCATESVFKALNFINVFRAIFKAPVEYMALVGLFFLNTIVGPIILIILVVLLQGIVGMTTQANAGMGVRMVSIFVSFIINVLSMGTAVYLAAVSGWCMGVFIYRNQKAFSHVR